jgi:RecB family exonuclease
MGATLFISPSAASRLRRAEAWLGNCRADAETLLVGGGHDGVQDLARIVSRRRGACFGWHRLSFHRLSLRLAERALLNKGLTPATPLGIETLWTRVVFELRSKEKLGRFQALGNQPGLPRALARTVEDCRLADIDITALDPNLASAARAFDEALAAAALADRAVVLRLAAAELSHSGHPLGGLPTLFLDVQVRTVLELNLISALASRAPNFLATVPAGDERTAGLLERTLQTTREQGDANDSGALARLQRSLFGAPSPDESEPSQEVAIQSAPGEMRECVEIARMIHREAARGTPFDKMAVLLRAPRLYRAPLFESLRRAGVPAHFARNTRMPDPAGRALLALLACAEEGLSASRFAEYLSLGEVPNPTPEGEPPAAASPSARWVPPDSEEAESAHEDASSVEHPLMEAEEERQIETANARVIAGALRAPRSWEKFLVDAAVIGGRARWERRLLGLAERFKADLLVPTASEAEVTRVRRNLEDLEILRAYALPLLDLLTDLPRNASWSEWLERLSELATRAVRHPSRILAVLSELAPMGVVGPVTLNEVQQVLGPRLLELSTAPAARRFGCVFVAPTEAVGGMVFEVVFVPGLAERIFPQRVREDPLLPDVERLRLDPALQRDDDRVEEERLHLKMAVGAAERRVVLSYPRLDVHEGRPRVPSFYGLEAIRATEGRLPKYEELRRRAESAVDARIGWPAPADPAIAIDFAERDLAVLDALFRGKATPPLGAARYLMLVNPFLARSLRQRYMRWQNKWTSSDGLVIPSPEAVTALSSHQLSVRSFSATSLQQFAACPYRFFLQGILKLAPREEAYAIEELDPLQRGSLIHEAMYEILTALRDEQLLPLKPSSLAAALARVDTILGKVAREYEDTFAPAIERVWKDGLDEIRADLRETLRLMADTSAQWTPWRFELAFGLASGSVKRKQQDPESRAEPVELDIGVKLRGSIDLVERSASGALRATDYKTGKAPEELYTVVGGGRKLQPVLYALALEKLFPGVAVTGGRLYFSTQRGRFAEVCTALDDAAKNAVRSVVSTIGEALEKGFFPAAPAKNECAWCDFNTVCGDHEEARTRRKPNIEALVTLREME